MAGFIQIIEFTTTRIDEMRALMKEERDNGALQDSLALRVVTAADQDRRDTYMSIAEFESHESAMKNSKRPETSQFASKFAELCDGPPRFYNLMAVDDWYQGS